jgi:hypothetical protein
MTVIQNAHYLNSFYVLATHGDHLQGGDTVDKGSKMIPLYNNTITVSSFTSLSP